MTEKRPKVKCWKCGRTYSMPQQPIVGLKLLVACPFCEVEGVVEMDASPVKTITIYKAHESPGEIKEAERDLSKLLRNHERPNLED